MSRSVLRPPARIALFAATLSLVAASAVPSAVAVAASPAASPSTLTIAISTDPLNFNPWGTADAYREVIDNIFDRLYSFDSNGNMIPVMAASLPTSTDEGLTWTVKLRHDVTWSDGVKFTSADVKFNYELIASTSVTTIDHPLFKNLVSVDTPDDFTDVFHFSAATLPWIFGSATSSMIQPVHIMGNVQAGGFQNFSSTLASGPWPGNHVGTGPYVPVSYVSGDSIILQANPHYWGPKPKTQKLIFKIIPDATTALLALQSGEVNVVSPNGYSFPVQDIKNLQSNSKLTVTPVASDGKYWITFSQYPEAIAANPWLGNVKVREALMDAIDRNAILNNVLGGLYPATWGVFSSNSWAYDPSLKVPPYNVALAKQMLDAAGYPVQADGSRFSVKFFYPDTGFFPLVAQALQQMFAQVDVTLNLSPVDQAAEVQILTTVGIRNYQMEISQNSGGPDPDSQTRYIKTAFIPPAAGSNSAGFSNPEVDQLLAQGASTTDQSARKAIYNQVNSVVASCYCYYDLTLVSNDAISQKDVTGWGPKVVDPYWSFGQLYIAQAAGPAAAGSNPTIPIVIIVVVVVAIVAFIAVRRRRSQAVAEQP